MGIRKTLAYHALSAGFGLAGRAASRRAANQSWKVVRRKDPPQNPASYRTSWKSALAWGALTGAAAGVAGVVAQRAAAGLWRKKVGRLPRGVR
jgi:hypothetical protein